ncbi:MAG: hypothetical protein HY835_05810 [Anaerolineae bacterium]|nr:hypothetical protein [Anaerolineae bacterium]
MKRISRLDRIAIALILLACFSYVFPRWADPNQNSRLDMVLAVVDDGTFVIDRYVANTVDYARVGEHTYSDKPPGIAFLGIPVYAGLKIGLDSSLMDGLVTRLENSSAFQSTLREGGSGVYADKVRFALAQVVLTLAIPVVASVVIGLLIYQLLTGFGLGAGLAAAIALAYGLLTPAFAYAGAFYSHQLTAALLLGAFALIQSRRFDQPARLLLVGLLLGYAVLSEYPAALASGILFVAVLMRLVRARGLWKIVWVGLPALACAVGLMAYNNAIFGSPFSLGYEYSELWTNQHSTGFMSLSLPSWDALWGMTFGRFRGLFVLSPWLLLGVPGFVFWLRSERRWEGWVSLLVFLSMFFFNASSVMWWGGFAVGPRYLLPGLPFLALAAGFALQRWQASGWLRGMAPLLDLWSLVMVWGLTLAGQAFPSDAIADPLLDYALPNWLAGNVARNAGTLLGLRGALSLLPLALVLLVLLAAWFVLRRRWKVGVGV